MSFEDDDDDDEQDAREAYPWLYGVKEEPYVPLRDQLEPKYQKVLDDERAKLLARREVVDEHGEDYHNIDEITDEMLPRVNFRVCDNLFLAKPANALLRAAKGKPREERRLFGDFWLEGEMTVLFGETGCGKSVLAMQIARALTGGPRLEPFEMDVEPGRLGYFDFELSEDQFRKRYTSDVPLPNGEAEEFPFSDRLIICSAQMLRSLPTGFDSFHDFLIHSIMDIVERFGTKFIIIDNITWLSPNLESSPNAQRLMKTLVQLKNRLRISILLLAHTKKRPPHTPIEIAHINGSKMLSLYVESMFAIGTSRRGKRLRYIKALKHRYTPDRDAETEVATVRIGKEGNFLGFTFQNFTEERTHVGWGYGHAAGVHGAEFVQQVKELADHKLTQRQIADQLGVGTTTVNRCLKG
ncbi:MAG: AAA family ATPase [Pyrinomonadaceae bacterium]